MDRDRREVQRLLRKAYDERLDHQPQEVPEEQRKAQAAKDLDELLGTCWRKYAGRAPDKSGGLEREKKDSEFFDKLSNLFEEMPVGHPAAPPPRKVRAEQPSRRGASVSVKVRT